jgi:hypothetical protein
VHVELARKGVTRWLLWSECCCWFNFDPGCWLNIDPGIKPGAMAPGCG